MPRINDGSFLFLQHMISKMKPAEEGGSPAGDRIQRLAAVHRGRRFRGVGDPAWIIENDWLEAVVALHD